MKLIPLLLFTILTMVGFYLIIETKFKNCGRILILLCISSVVAFVAYVCYLFVLFTTHNAVFYSIIAICIGAIIVAFVAGCLWGVQRRKAFYIPLCISLGICVFSVICNHAYKEYIRSIPVVSENEKLWAEYAPYAQNSKVAVLNEPSSLVLKDDLPVMDGGTALYPVYASFARAVYPKTAIESFDSGSEYNQYNKYLMCNKTAGAYEKLIAGEADIIFVPAASEDQKLLAKEMGVELVYTPIVKDAFVFFVNPNNPIDDISIEQLQDIYSGKITTWDELDAYGLGEIKAFQRNEGSISQRAIELFMDGKPLMKPPMEDVFSDVGLVVSRAADYKNFRNSIGYSFRFYSTEMVKNEQIKLLSMNGVAPTLENVKNGTYPALACFYAVTRSDADENTKKLLDWITSEQGQKLVEMTGYTPVK